MVKIKAGFESRIQDWAATINSRKDEVIATLIDEEVAIESVFHLRLHDGEYLVYYMKGPDLNFAVERAKTSKHSIDLYHQEFKRDAWESVQVLPQLIDFENFDGLKPNT